jgi:hypothetical protein
MEDTRHRSVDLSTGLVAVTATGLLLVAILLGAETLAIPSIPLWRWQPVALNQACDGRVFHAIPASRTCSDLPPGGEFGRKAFVRAQISEC